jgi:hypothetical protein
MRELTTDDDFETIQIWLNTNLKENKSFVPCKDSIHNPKSKKEVSSKGLYFWFIHPNGYDKLNKIIPIESILENRFTKKINGIDYDLVYVGTAGVRNNKNGVNNGNLFERFNWHIKNNQTLNSLKNNSISTLRRTIIPLFSDDLFKNESQQELNQLFKKYFHLFYLDYGTEFLEVKDLIKSDETILITKLKPIFNLKENDNTQNSSHITAQVQTLRNKIEKDTKIRLGYPLTKNNMNTKSEKNKLKVKDRKDNNPMYSGVNLISENGCATIKVNFKESIHDKVISFPNLPIPCEFICRNSSNPSEIVYPKTQKKPKRQSGKIGKQNIYDYFLATDKDYAERNNLITNNNYRWQIIQQEMLINNIENIIVTICPI